MLLETSDAERAAEMDALLAEFWYRGEPERSSEHLERAYALVNELAPSPAKAHVISQVARYRMLAGAREEAIRIGEQALAIAEHWVSGSSKRMRSSTSAPQRPTWVTAPGSKSFSAPSRSPPRRARPTLHGRRTI